MALRDKIKNWESELEKVRAMRQEAVEKFDKKENELLKKIKDANERIDIENNKMVGDIVREMYGELNEENIMKFKDLMKKTMNASANGTDRQ